MPHPTSLLGPLAALPLLSLPFFFTPLQSAQIAPSLDTLSARTRGTQPQAPKPIAPTAFPASGVSTIATNDLTDVTAMDLADALIGDLFPVTAASLILGNPAQAGTFMGAGAVFGIDEGVVLSSGNIADISNRDGTNESATTSTIFNGPGYGPLDVLLPADTIDAAVLSVDFTATGGEQIVFDYVFGSEEYGDILAFLINDGFGLYLNGVEITPVTVSTLNINSELPSNPALYIDNVCPTYPCLGLGTELDGFTVVLHAAGTTVPGTNTLVLAVADDFFLDYDSAILIEGNVGLANRLTLEAPECQSDQDLVTTGVQVFYDLFLRSPYPTVTGFQAFLEFDPSLMTYEGTLSSYSTAPFGAHLLSIDMAETSPGHLQLDGNAFSGPLTGIDQDAHLATLVFTLVLPDCKTIGLDFDPAAAFASELSFLGVPLPTILVDGPAVLADATAPVLVAPADITVTADAGVADGCTSAVVTFSPTVMDCDTDPTLVCTPASGSAFPVGTTNVVCTATDDCGNSSTTNFLVNVTSTNLFDVDVQLNGVMTATTRCIEFVLDGCVSQSIELDFDATGRFVGPVELACGTWSTLCAKDEQHTQWDLSNLSLSGDGTRWVADSQLVLEGGDTDNDGDIDINDVTWLLAQFGDFTLAGGCPFDGTTRDADFNNNGAVGAGDYQLLALNWLTATACPCAISAGSAGTQVERQVDDVASRAADLDANGIVDVNDVELFEQLHGLSGELSARMRATR